MLIGTAVLQHKTTQELESGTKMFEERGLVHDKNCAFEIIELFT
jgi:hypothetical protein